MDGAAVKELADRYSEPQMCGELIVKPAGWITEDPQALIKPGPQASAFAVATIGALRDYLVANRDSLDLTKVVVHVAGPASVTLNGPLAARARSRETFVTATAVDLTSGFLGKFMALEDFLVGLMVRFADTPARAALLSLLSTVKHETVGQASDNGISQTVQATAGIVLATVREVPNPVELQPYRTFRDVLQPTSAFVLRLQSGKAGLLPEAALFEADGGAWRLIAIDRVRDWLKLELEKASVDVAVLA